MFVVVCVEDRGACQVSHQSLYSLETGSLTEAETRLAVSKPSGHSVSVHHCAQLCPEFYVVARNLNSGSILL